MNCRNTQQLNITCGTDVVLHDKLMFDDEVFDPNVSVDIECNLVNSLGKRTSLEYEIADEELVIQVPWVDGRNAGCYGLEVKGKCNGKTWATHADSLIRYTRATVEGAAVVETESDWYDVTQVVSYRYSDSPLDEVDATIDDNYGEPTVTPTYEHNKLTLDFKNLRGNGIVSVEQTVTSTEDEGVNETTITQDNGNTTVMQVRNGSKGNKGDKGDTGDSAIFDPSTGNISEMKQATGGDALSPMSQKAVTDAVNYFNGSRYDNYTKADCHMMPYEPANGYIDKSQAKRIRFIRKVTKGSRIVASCAEGKGVAVCVYDSFYKCILAQDDYLQNISFSYAASVDAYIEYDGYVVVTLCKSDATQFTSAQFTTFVNAVSISITPSLAELVHPIYNDGILEESYMTPYNSTNITIKSSPTRLRIIYPVTVGCKVTASCSQGKGVAASIYDTLEKCFKGGSNYLQSISYSYISPLEGVCNYDGYLCLSLCKDDSSVFTDSDIATFMAAFSATVSLPTPIADMQEEIGNVASHVDSVADLIEQDGRKDLFLGSLVQKAMSATELIDSTKRVSMVSCCVVPYMGVTLHFKLPADYHCGIRSGAKFDNLSNNDYWYGDGDTFTFASNVVYFRLCFFKGSTATEGYDITAEEVKALLDSGDIRITFDEKDDVFSRNYECEKYVKAVMRKFVSGGANNSSLNKYPVFVHTSDVHGDAKRFLQAVEYADYIKADAFLASGDLASIPHNSSQYARDIADAATTKVMVCVGNHDAYTLTTQQQNEQITDYLINKYSSVVNPEEDYPTYYYQDFASKKIRLISLNLYEGTRNNDWENINFSQEQCEWFIAALASTPQDYGVLVMMHAPETIPVAPEGKTDFRQPILNYAKTHADQGMSGKPFAAIIDAFIGKTTASVTYSCNGIAIDVSADFTSVASGVEFIAYVTGHLHTDTVGYMPNTTHPQLNLNVCCGVCEYGTTYTWLAHNSDLPRGGKCATQDSFNVYMIDRANHVVRIAKVGSNVTADMTDRKIMKISYK